MEIKDSMKIVLDEKKLCDNLNGTDERRVILSEFRNREWVAVNDVIKELGEVRQVSARLMIKDILTELQHITNK